MSITVYEVPGRSFETDPDGYESGSRKWKVVCDTLNPMAADIATAIGVNHYDAHPQRPACIAQTIKMAQQESDGVVWVVEIPYSSKPFQASPQPDGTQLRPSDSKNQLQAPELRPAVWSFDRKEFMRVVEFDALASALRIENSAGQPFDPPLQVPASNMIIRVEFYRATINIADLRLLWDTINDAAWQGFPARTLRVNDLSAKSTFEKAGDSGLISYWTITLELEQSKKPWNPTKVRDRGSVEAIVQDGVTIYRQIRGGGGDPMVADLNGNGQRTPAGAGPTYLVFNLYEQVSFTDKFF
ncbi:hypothetical protein [Limnoglobus roseus]|uniref:Uncharacterized protein n=1 Tax=Limnoglobus roseus TaxID=2598579 RepID=A0A5C1A5R9_9BACT|nr:hypothetical protein [Limnoglobus roseus]QEL14050.1 hypothetical protein PX52LOC_00913 [Limnoglobus roseus]